MSSAIYITLDPDCPISLEDFERFCKQHSVRYSPNTIGQNVFYADDVEIKFGDSNYDKLPRLANGRYDFDKARPRESATRVTFSTYFCGGACPQVVRLALAFWQEHGGDMDAAPELRAIICRPLLEGIEV